MSSDLARLFSRIAVAALFLYTGIRNALGFESFVGQIASAGYPVAGLMGVVACAASTFGGLSVGLGALSRWGSAALLVFLVPTTLTFHLLPAIAGDPMQAIQTLKNLAICGPLVLLAIEGPGAFSVDALRAWRRI